MIIPITSEHIIGQGYRYADWKVNGVYVTGYSKGYSRGLNEIIVYVETKHYGN